MYPENPEGTQVIVDSMNMGYISNTAGNRTHNLFRPKCEPIPLGHWPQWRTQRVVNDWNSLPDAVVSAPMVNSFKNRLDKWLEEERWNNPEGWRLRFHNPTSTSTWVGSMGCTGPDPTNFLESNMDPPNILKRSVNSLPLRPYHLFNLDGASEYER